MISMAMMNSPLANSGRGYALTKMCFLALPCPKCYKTKARSSQKAKQKTKTKKEKGQKQKFKCEVDKVNAGTEHHIAMNPPFDFRALSPSISYHPTQPTPTPNPRGIGKCNCAVCRRRSRSGPAGVCEAINNGMPNSNRVEVGSSRQPRKPNHVFGPEQASPEPAGWSPPAARHNSNFTPLKQIYIYPSSVQQISFPVVDYTSIRPWGNLTSMEPFFFMAITPACASCSDIVTYLAPRGSGLKLTALSCETIESVELSQYPDIMTLRCKTLQLEIRKDDLQNEH